MLSGAGKEILVRVCAQALPNYAMNCFLLPKTFCDDLHQLFAKFWWEVLQIKGKSTGYLGRLCVDLRKRVGWDFEICSYLILLC